jgi:hypothetical protein
MALAQGMPCDANTAWLHVRQAYPNHSQTLAQCENKLTGERVIVLTEPPPHLVRGNAESIVKALFSVPISSVQHKRHALGYDGWTEDLVIVARPRTTEQVKALSDGLALLSMFAYGSSYKAEVEDITRLAPAKYWEAPPAVEVTAEELFSWLLGPKAEMLVPLDGGDGATLKERAARKETGAYQSESTAPGFIVALLPAGLSADLNNHVDDLRRFAIDTDTFLGALRITDDRVALVGRERTASLAAMPPLRVETLLLLASYRSAQLSQSYERHRAFAGKLYSRAGDLFGWDWAPVLLSDVLIDTELGSLLNLTDDMLKGWSESGRIEYKGFSHDKPKQFPFTNTGAFKLLAAKSLTYNWNTAGVGVVSTKDHVDIFVIHNTGSLPVSYFPEGSQSDAVAKAKLIRAEDTAYKYFSSLRNPLLGRAVQYAALFQVFQAFDMQAKPPQAEAPDAASFTTVEELLEKEVNQALAGLADPATPSTADFLLSVAYFKFGDKGREFEFRDIPEVNAELKKLRIKAAAKIAKLDRENPSWRKDYIKQWTAGEPMPKDLKVQVDDLGNHELSLVVVSEQVREGVLSVTQHDPVGWIKTPSIVVSRGEDRELTGGHNIGGEPTRVELDASIPVGKVEASGSYEDGRVLRINPADGPAAQDIVRTFDREVGLRDANMPNGILAAEAKLSEKPVVARPLRPMQAALEFGGLPPRVIRGAQPNTNAILVGYRPGAISANARAQIETIAAQSQAQVVVTRLDEGFAILSTQSGKFTLAPNPTSLYSALDREVRTAPGRTPKIVFNGLTTNEVELTIRNVATRLKEASGAGGQPPFGGDRPLSVFDDGKQPGGNFWNRKPPERRLGLAAADRKAIQVDGRDAELLKATPQWGAAEVNVRSSDTVLFANGPDFGDANQHITEVSVPVAAEGGRLKRMFINAVGVFRKILPGARRQAIDAAVTKVFKPTEPIDVRAALTRYKSMMIDEFQADDVWINLRQEGADVIVTEVPGGSDVTEAPSAAAPRG